MPGRNRGESCSRSNKRQQRRTEHIELKRESEPGQDTEESARKTKFVNFAEKQRDHQRSLERPNPAASLVDANHSSANLNNIAVQDRGNVEEP